MSAPAYQLLLHTIDDHAVGRSAHSYVYAHALVRFVEKHPLDEEIPKRIIEVVAESFRLHQGSGTHVYQAFMVLDTLVACCGRKFAIHFTDEIIEYLAEALLKPGWCFLGMCRQLQIWVLRCIPEESEGPKIHQLYKDLKQRGVLFPDPLFKKLSCLEYTALNTRQIDVDINYLWVQVLLDDKHGYKDRPYIHKFIVGKWDPIPLVVDRFDLNYPEALDSRLWRLLLRTRALTEMQEGELEGQPGVGGGAGGLEHLETDLSCPVHRLVWRVIYEETPAYCYFYALELAGVVEKYPLDEEIPKVIIKVVTQSLELSLWMRKDKHTNQAFTLLDTLVDCCGRKFAIHFTDEIIACLAWVLKGGCDIIGICRKRQTWCLRMCQQLQTWVLRCIPEESEGPKIHQLYKDLKERGVRFGPPRTDSRVTQYASTLDEHEVRVLNEHEIDHLWVMVLLKKYGYTNEPHVKKYIGRWDPLPELSKRFELKGRSFNAERFLNSLVWRLQFPSQATALTEIEKCLEELLERGGSQSRTVGEVEDLPVLEHRASDLLDGDLLDGDLLDGGLRRRPLN